MTIARFARDGEAEYLREAGTMERLYPVTELRRWGFDGFSIEDEAKHFVVCAVCLQAFDERNFEELLHHSMPEHDPIPLDS